MPWRVPWSPSNGHAAWLTQRTALRGTGASRLWLKLGCQHCLHCQAVAAWPQSLSASTASQHRQPAPPAIKSAFACPASCYNVSSQSLLQQRQGYLVRVAAMARQLACCRRNAVC
jgi:hypothetical protein